jgi:hypothetical protein
LKRVYQTLPLHKKIESKFKETMLVPELEKKKRMLQELHSNFKPIDSYELSRHSEKYEKIKSQLLQKRRNQRNLNYSTNIKTYKQTLVINFIFYRLGKSPKIKILRRHY